MPRLRQIVQTVKKTSCAGCSNVITGRRMAVIVSWKIGDPGEDPVAMDLEDSRPDVVVENGELRIIFPEKMPLAEPPTAKAYHLDGCGVVTHQRARKPVSGDAGRGKRAR